MSIGIILVIKPFYSCWIVSLTLVSFSTGVFMFLPGVSDRIWDILSSPGTAIRRDIICGTGGDRLLFVLFIIQWVNHNMSSRNEEACWFFFRRCGIVHCVSH